MQRLNNTAAPENQARLALLDWTRIGKGVLVGKARVRLPNGLEISDVGIFQKDGRRWAQLPAEPMRDFAGAPLKDPTTGKVRYRSLIRWESRELQNAFSQAVIAAIEDEHGPLDQVVEPAPRAAPPPRPVYRRPQSSDRAPPNDRAPLDDEIPF